VRETLDRMNAGMALEAILRDVRPPARLADRPYLHAVYDEPEYVVRNVWRLYGGWYDGVPSHLEPAREDEIGREVAALAGGVGVLVARARALAASGDARLASHPIDWAVAAAPDDARAQEARAAIYEQRAKGADALMTRGIFTAAARESAARATTRRGDTTAGDAVGR
jgi:alkyl sulfatase BDS1-like metallo-beta-lactamase superfamily hydrolase